LSWKGALLAGGLAAVQAALAGCTGAGFRLEDLPDAPLAIVYRTREESERRVEMLERAKEPPTIAKGNDRYSLRIEEAIDAFGLGRSSEDRAADLLGRMAVVAPAREEVHPYDFALTGDRPYDWSENHERLLFRSLRHDGLQLFEWNVANGNIRPLTAGPAAHHSGCYGPEGRLAYARHEPSAGGGGSQSRIYVTGRGGGLPRPVSPGPHDQKPVWSPDGSVILYETTDPAERAAIAALEPDGEDSVRLIARGRDPDFTPDGGWVVYSAHTRWGWRLYQMRPDGTGKRPIGQSPRDEHDPTVSPDGRFIVYVADDEQRQQLRVRSRDGSGDRPLLFHGDGIAPVW
jgi:hypothetical protein